MIPCIGYPSRSAAVRALRGRGMTVSQIAAATGLGRDVVPQLLATECASIRQLFKGPPRGRKVVVETAPLDANGIVTGVLSPAARATRSADIRSASEKRVLLERRAKTLPRFQLRQGEAFLHMSGEGLTADRRNAWIGFQANLDALRRVNPAARQMTAVEVPPPSRGTFTSLQMR